MSAHNHVLQLTLTPAGLREPKLSEGTMYTRTYVVPEIMRNNLAATSMLKRMGHKLAMAMAESDYAEIIKGLVIPTPSYDRWDGFSDEDLREMQMQLSMNQYRGALVGDQSPYIDEINRVLKERRG